MSSPTDASLRLRRLTNRSFSSPFSHASATSPGIHSHDRHSSKSSSEGLHQTINVDQAGLFHDPWSNEDDEAEENIEADVLFPQYTSGNVDLSLLDEMVDRKMSGDVGSLNLTRTISKRSKDYGENSVKYGGDDIEHFRFHIYSSKPNGLPTQCFQHLLTEEGRNMLEKALKTPGWWIDVLSPTDEEMKILSKTFNIHPLTTEDVFAQEPREKMELFPNYTFICFRSFNIESHSEQVRPFTFYILIFKEGLLTFHFKSSELPGKVRRRTDQLKTHVEVTPDWLNYALMDAITDEFAPILQQIEIEAVSIDELSLVLKHSEKTDMLRRITRCRRRSTQISRLLSSKLDVLRSLMKRYDDWARGNTGLEGDTSPANRKILSDVCLYLGDVQDHVVTMAQNISHYNRILSRAHTNHLAQVNAELSETYTMTNNVMNRLTFLATVFVPLTVAGGIFGMNVKVAGQDYADLNFFFWIICGMALYSIVMAFMGRYIKLL